MPSTARTASRRRRRPGWSSCSTTARSVFSARPCRPCAFTNTISSRSNIGKAQAIIAHLRDTLDFKAGGAVAGHLNSLYVGLFDALTDANIHDKPERVEEVIEALRELREAWVEVDRQCQAGKASGQDAGSDRGLTDHIASPIVKGDGDTDTRIEGATVRCLLATGNTERAKFGYLLELSQEQVQALECDDMFAFDRILAAKRTLIESLSDARGLLAADPTLAGVVTRIQDADKMAQRLLYRKVGRIMREMNELNQQKKARGAYRTDAAPRHAPSASCRTRPAIWTRNRRRRFLAGDRSAVYILPLSCYNRRHAHSQCPSPHRPARRRL